MSKETERCQFEETFWSLTGWDADEYPSSDVIELCWEIWQARANLEKSDG